MIGCCVGIAPERCEVSAALAALRECGVSIELAAEPAGDAIAVAFVGQADVRRVRELAATCERLLAIVLGDDDPLALLAAGASDAVALRGPADARHVANRIERWLAVDKLVAAPVVADNLVGAGRAWRGLLRRLVELARFTSASLLLAGESGTGKELVARLVHTLDPRPDKAELIVVDCTTIVPTLSGSEFFGHERGAFTGAAAVRDGAFALADRGTLFLDEVGDLPLPLQAQLLRVIQEHTYKRVGGNEWRRTEFRLVCASHRDLAAAVRRGEFRHDLYHRIATWTLALPALAERRDDIPALVRHFLDRARAGLELDPAVERFLCGRAYPGNVRELQHAVQRLVDRCPDDRITVGQIPDDERVQLAGDAPASWPDQGFEGAVRDAVSAGIGLKGLRKTTDDLAVRIALTLENGNVGRASRRLGVTERALQLRQAAWRDQTEPADDVS